MPKTTLTFGLVVVLGLTLFIASGYWEAYTLTTTGRSPMALLAGIPTFIFLIAFICMAIVTLIRILLKKVKPVWLLSIIIPIILVPVIVLAPRPSILDVMTDVIAQGTSDQGLLRLAAEIRAQHNALTKTDEWDLVKIEEPFRERMPTVLHNGYDAYYRLSDDIVYLTFGPRKGKWGIEIYDRKPDQNWSEPQDEGRFYREKISDSVWLLFNSY